MKRNMILFISIMVGILFFAMTGNAEEVEASAGGFSMASAIGLLAAGIAIAIAAFGGAFAQGRTAAATMEGIARNPGAQSQMFMPWIVSMALIESLVIYALVIAFMILGKVK